jgi:hypothetical protein
MMTWCGKKSIQSGHIPLPTTTPMKFGKELAHAYILTHEGYPTIFIVIMRNGWTKQDEQFNLDPYNKATGNTSILFTDTDEYIARRNGIQQSWFGSLH